MDHHQLPKETESTTGSYGYGGAINPLNYLSNKNITSDIDDINATMNTANIATCWHITATNAVFYAKLTAMERQLQNQQVQFN
jgi:hypothetical protein